MAVGGVAPSAGSLLAGHRSSMELAAPLTKDPPLLEQLLNAHQRHKERNKRGKAPVEAPAEDGAPRRAALWENCTARIEAQRAAAAASAEVPRNSCETGRTTRVKLADSDLSATVPGRRTTRIR